MKYNDILLLKDLLETNGIPFDFSPLFDGFQICYPVSDSRICSVIEHKNSYGSSSDLLEMRGLLTLDEEESDDVVGYLTSLEVYDRIKNHWDENKILIKEMYDL